MSEEQSWAVGGKQPEETQDTKRFWHQTWGTSEATGIWVTFGGDEGQLPNLWEHVLAISWTPQTSTWGRVKPPQVRHIHQPGKPRGGTRGGPTKGCSTTCRKEVGWGWSLQALGGC